MFEVPYGYTRRLELIHDAFLLGFISLSLQVIFARLAVGFAGGNEVYLSLFYFFWLLFAGIGAALIKSAGSKGIWRPAVMFIALAVVALVGACIIYLSPKALGVIPGQLIPPPAYLITIIAVLTPIGLLNGGLFSSIASNFQGRFRASATYSAEAFGALVGGAVATLHYAAGGRDFSYLLFVALLSLLPLLRHTVLVRGRLVWQLTVLGGGLVVLLAQAGNFIEDQLLAIRYSPLGFHAAASGRLIRYDSVRRGNFTSLYSGGLKVADFPDSISGQELFYWPYLIKPDLQSVAFVGGEAAYVDWLIPPGVIKTYIYAETRWRKLVDPRYLPSLEDSRQHDPVAYFRHTNERFDAIIINLGELLSLCDRRLETSAFLTQCKRRLAPDGILSVSLPAYEGLWHDDLKARLSRVHGTLEIIFDHVNLVPGSRITFIAGDSISEQFSVDMATERLGSLNIDSPYFTPALLTSRLNAFQLDQTARQLAPGSAAGPENPLSIAEGLSYHFSKLGMRMQFAKIAVVVLLGMFVLAAVSLAIGVGHSGVPGSLLMVNIFYFGAVSFAIELLVFYRVQLAGGYLYVAFGIIVGLFMAGMAVGAILGTRDFSHESSLARRALAWQRAPFAVLVILCGILSLNIGSIWHLLAVVLLAGFAGGLGFGVSSRLFDQRPGAPYAVDLAGAIVGTVCGLAILSSALTVHLVLAVAAGLGLALFATNRLNDSKLNL